MLLCGIHNYNLNEWRIRCDSIYHNLNDHSIPAGLFSCFQILSIKSNEAISIFMHVALSSFQIDCSKINSQKGDYWFRRHEILFMAADMYFQMSFQNCDSEFTRPPASHEPVGLGKRSTILVASICWQKFGSLQTSQSMLAFSCWFLLLSLSSVLFCLANFPSPES